MKNKNIKLISIFAFLMVCSFSSNVLIASSEVNFDPKLQLTEYLSYGANVIDAVYGNFDKDSNLDLAVAFESSVAIYEKETSGFVKVDEFGLGDTNFIGESSNITSLAIGDTIGRSILDQIDEVKSVSNSTNCKINYPVPDNLTYLENDDANWYNLTFAMGGNGNFTVDLELNYGTTINSFDLEFDIYDDKSAFLDFAWLYVYNFRLDQWDQWVDLSENTGWTIWSNSSSQLPNMTSDYFNSNHIFRIQFRINHALETNLWIDYITLKNITVESATDIIVGGGSGELAIIRCTSTTANTYNAEVILNSADYGGLGKQITDITTGDLDNDNRKEILITTSGQFIYVIQPNKAAAKGYNIKQALNMGGSEQGTSIAVYDPTTSASKFEICAGSKSGGNGRITKVTYNSTTNMFSSVSGTSTPTQVTDIAITNILGDSNREIIAGYLSGMTRILDFNTFTRLWNSETLIPTGNPIIAVAVGDFATSDTPLVAISPNLATKKIQVINPTTNGSEVYWDSSVYMREPIINLFTYQRSGVDSLVVIANRHISVFSVEYPDSDGDKLSDLSERLHYRTDPNIKDSDSDGLDDGVEIFVIGTDPMNGDTDGDLMPDGFEVSMGTDPLDPMSSLLVYILIPAIFIIAAISIIYSIRKTQKQKKAEYQRVKNTPNLLPQVRRLIVQRLETYSKEFEGFKDKKELSKFKRNISLEMMAIVLDRLYNFLEYLRLKGILFTDREEEMLKKIVDETMEPVVKKTDTMLKTLLMYETKYKQFNEQFVKLLDSFADWKKAAKVGTKVVEELIRCPKCETLQPKGSAFCLECGEKLVK